MADEDMLEREGPQTWRNWHDTVRGRIAGIDMIHYPSDTLPYGSAAINRCTAAIQRSIADARARRVAHRGVGRGWSLSTAPLTDGVLLDTSRLKGKKRLEADQLDPGFSGGAGRAARLALVQCGNYVSELGQWLESDRNGLSFATTGAANGQTIIGATSTGTHGSALDYRGALHDQIVAIHLLAGEGRQFWLERASDPVIKHTLPLSIGAELVRDDELFNAVVMGLGAFGIIHNVVIEARERFLLRAYNYDRDRAGNRMVLDPAMRNRIGRLDFTSDPVLDPPGRSGRPYFFQPIINPNTNPPEVLVTQMYEEPWPAGYRPEYGLKQDNFGPGYDFVSVAGRALDLFDDLVPLFARLVAQQLFEVGETRGSWGEVFGYKAFRTKVASGTVAVPLAHALDTLDLLVTLNQAIGPAPLVYGCRYVRRSPALLAFNRWDPTFVISIDGVYNEAALRFFAAIPERMEARGIPFTQHWGKTNGYTPRRVRAAYGADYDRWIAARHRLLPDPATRALFTNAYMRERGLDV